MNSESEITLRNLGVIGAMSENDKINTKEEVFSIYSPTTFRGVARLLYYRESREHNIQKVSQCIREAKTFIIASMNEIYTEDMTQNDSNFLRQLNRNTKTQICTRMLRALNHSLTGLKAMSITYKDDASCVSRLDNLAEDIRDFLHTTKTATNGSSVLTLENTENE